MPSSFFLTAADDVDMLIVTCSHMDSVAQFCNLSRTCKSMKRFFFSSPLSNTLWGQLVKNVCGFDIVYGSQPAWYRAMITICPYFSKPVICKTSFKNMRKFELARKKDDGELNNKNNNNAVVVLLWCEKADCNDWSYIQQSGKLRRIITPDDVKFNDKPESGIPVPSQLLRDWVRFGEGRQQQGVGDNNNIRWIDFHFCEGMKVFQLHKNLFAACCNIKSRSRIIFFTMDRSSSSSNATAVVTTVRVLHTMRAFVNTLQIPSKQKVFFSHDAARLCVRTNADEVTCYGPTRSDFRSWRLDTSVSIRRIIRGEATSAELEEQFIIIRSTEKQQIDAITGWTLLRCALTERNSEVSMDIVRLAEKHHCRLKTLDDDDRSSSGDGSSPLFIAIETGFVSMVRYLVSQTSTHVNFTNREGCSTFGMALNNPEILEIMMMMHSSSPATTTTTTTSRHIIDNLWTHFRQDYVVLCEPALHVIKKACGLHLSEINSLRLMQVVITKNMFDDDVGLLVMNARFLRTLILDDEYMDEIKQAALIRYAVCNSCFYMVTFLQVVFIE